MPDARLKTIAADAAARGWEIRWSELDQRTELLIVPAVSSADQQGSLGIGVGVRLGGKSLSCWVWEAWTGTLIEPWVDRCVAAEDDHELLFPTVSSLEECCQVFDRAARRYMVFMRRSSLECFGPEGDLSDWADLAPLATASGHG